MLIRAAFLSIALAGAPALALAQEVPPAGLAAEGRRQWEQALRIYREVLAREPRRHELWIRVSDIEARLGRKLAAAEALRAAAEAKGNDAQLWRGAAAAFSEADRPREALAAHERAVALETGRVEDVLLRAQLATWIGDNKLAAEAYEEHYRRTKAPDSLLNLALYGSLAWLYRRKKFDGQIFATYLICYAVTRSFVEFFRGDYAPAHIRGGWLTPAQLVSVGILAAGLILFFLLRMHRGGNGNEVPVQKTRHQMNSK